MTPVATHCLPTGSLGTGQVPVPPVNPSLIQLNDSTIIVGGVVKRRGRILLLPDIGGSTAANPFWEVPSLVDNDLILFLNALGFQTVQVSGVPQNGDMFNDIFNDPSSKPGTRYLNTHLLHHDHIMDYCNKNFSGTMPTFVVGMGWGAWVCHQLAIHRTTGPYAISGAYTHCSPCDFSQINPTIIPQFSAFNTSAWTGLNLGPTALNGIQIPLRITWAYNDNTITGGHGIVPPPSNLITVMINACNAAGIEHTTYSVIGAPVAATLVGTNISAAANNFFSGTGIVNIDSSVSISNFPPASVASPCAAIISNVQTSSSIINVCITYTGTNATINALTGCTYNHGVSFGTSSAIVQSSSTVSSALGIAPSGALSTTTWTGPGNPNISGAGQPEDHQWDVSQPTSANTTQVLFNDSADCLAWFDNIILPWYPAVH